MKKVLLPMAITAILANTAGAQVKIGNNPATIDAASLLELEHPNKALYLNRVSLVSTTDVTTVPSPKAGMTVYNTNTAMTGTSTNPAIPGGAGEYYYDGTRWVGKGATAITTAPNDWHISGNPGTTEAANFLGTTDNVALNFRVNGIKAGRIGTSAGTDQNTALGVQSLTALTSGSNNTATGNQALMANTSGSSNTATGNIALAGNTTGYLNNAFGGQALTGNTGGVQNSAFGNSALQSNVAGNYNTGLGNSSLKSTTSSQNTAVGYNALGNNTSGGNNTALGTYADVPAGSTISNATAIGYLAQVAASNAMVLGSVNGVNGATASVNVGIGTATPASTLDVKGSQAGQYRTVAGNTILTATDYYLTYTNNSAAGTITLPAAISGVGNFAGRVYYIRNTTAIQLLALVATGAELIDGNAGIVIPSNSTVEVISTGATSGTTWEIAAMSNNSPMTSTQIFSVETATQQVIPTTTFATNIPQILTFPTATSNITINTGGFATFNSANSSVTINAPGTYAIDVVGDYNTTGTATAYPTPINLDILKNGTQIDAYRVNIVNAAQASFNTNIYYRTILNLNTSDVIQLALELEAVPGYTVSGGQVNVSRPTGAQSSKRLTITKL